MKAKPTPRINKRIWANTPPGKTQHTMTMTMTVIMAAPTVTMTVTVTHVVTLTRDTMAGDHNHGRDRDTKTTTTKVHRQQHKHPTQCNTIQHKTTQYNAKTNNKRSKQKRSDQEEPEIHQVWNDTNTSQAFSVCSVVQHGSNKMMTKQSLCLASCTAGWPCGGSSLTTRRIEKRSTSLLAQSDSPC